MEVLGTLRAGQKIVLRDGSRIRIRPIAPGDERPMLDFLERLSVHSRYLRFFSLCPDLARAAHSSAVRSGDRYGLVACLEGCRDVVGHAGYWWVRPGRAELALAVADRFQGRGLGRILLNAITEAAAAYGFCALEMEVLPGNHALLNLLSHNRFPVHVELAAGVIVCELCLRQPAARPRRTNPSPFHD